MSQTTPTAVESRRNSYREITLALLIGIATMSVLGFLVEIAQPPEIPLTIWITPVFAFVTLLAAISLPLVWWDNAAGYGMSVLTGIGAVVGMVAYVLELLGPARVAPASVIYAGIGLLIVATTVVAWRERSATEESTTRRSSTGQVE